MRTEFKATRDIFTIAIADAPFPQKLSRDEAPFLLKGIQSIYLNEAIYSKVYPILEKAINSKSGAGNGRKAMGFWEIFVLAVMRNGLNVNYDKLHYLANYDHLMRCVMGVGTEASRIRNGKEYSLTTIKNNVALLDISTINEINEIVVAYGHQIVKKRRDHSPNQSRFFRSRNKYSLSY
jgi:hypothetical protein